MDQLVSTKSLVFKISTFLRVARVRASKLPSQAAASLDSDENRTIHKSYDTDATNLHLEPLSVASWNTHVSVLMFYDRSSLQSTLLSQSIA